MRGLDKVWLAALLALAADPAAATPRAPPLAGAVAGYARAHDFSGTILITRAGAPLYKGSFGLADRAFGVPATPATRFKIASITKLFTAVLVLQLAEEGKLDLQAPAGRYLPELADKPAGAVTLHQLLHHRSGLPQWDQVGSYQEAFAGGVERYQKPLGPAALLSRCCTGALAGTPGGPFAYNNADYFVLGNVLERVGGKSYAQLLAERILRPLRLDDTGMLRWDAVLPRLAPTYFRRPDNGALISDMPVYYENWYAAAGMYSDADDLARFADALFGGRLIGAGSLGKLLAPELDDYGYGLWSYSFARGGRRYRVAKRPGSVMGANAVLYRLLDSGTTIVILANTNRADLDAFAQKIADVLVANEARRKPVRAVRRAAPPA